MVDEPHPNPGLLRRMSPSVLAYNSYSRIAIEGSGLWTLFYLVTPQQYYILRYTSRIIYYTGFYFPFSCFLVENPRWRQLSDDSAWDQETESAV